MCDYERRLSLSPTRRFVIAYEYKALYRYKWSTENAQLDTLQRLNKLIASEKRSLKKFKKRKSSRLITLQRMKKKIRLAGVSVFYQNSDHTNTAMRTVISPSWRKLGWQNSASMLLAPGQSVSLPGVGKLSVTSSNTKQAKVKLIYK